MDIKLSNVDTNFVFETKGPQVEFELQDKGQAVVTMMLSLDDGTHFSYPTGGGKSVVLSTTLAPRIYLGVLTIVAAELKNFGRNYRSTVNIGGKLLATARGDIPDGASTDQFTQLFQLRVKK